VSEKDFKKIDLIKSLSAKTGYPKSYTKKLVEDLIKIMITNIKKGSFNIKNFGKFKIIEKKERIGRNPKTKKKHIINARKSISFISSKKYSNNHEQIN
jgi:integration host factor subunit alpha